MICLMGSMISSIFFFSSHTVAEVQAITEDLLEEYNAIRPHEALGNVPPYHYDPIQL